MSPIKDLRELNEGNITDKIRKPYSRKKQPATYQPLFMMAMKRKGVFLMSEQTYKDETQSCISFTGCSLERYLFQNNMKIEKCRIGWKVSLGEQK